MLDNLDKELLNLLQTRFPIDARPYLRIAEKLKISEEEVINRIKRLMDSNIIRRFGGVFDSRKLGYQGTLCALKVPEDRIEEAAAVVNSYPGVTHNYLRNHAYNMWFTVLATSPQKVNNILAEISEKTGITDTLNLPVKKFVKLKVSFKL